MSEAMKTTGVNELLAKYERMGKAGLPIGKAAVREGGKIVRDSYVAHSPEAGGKTRQAVRMSVRASKKTGATASVGFSRKAFNVVQHSHKANPHARKANHDAFYVTWADEGHFTGPRLAKGAEGKGSGAKARYKSLSEAAGRKHVKGLHWIEAARKASLAGARDAINQKLTELVRQADAAGGVVRE